jgi:uncharacterized protein YcbX
VQQVTLSAPGLGSETFGFTIHPSGEDFALADVNANPLTPQDLDQERQRMERWLSLYFGEPVFLREDPVQGFPDDRQASGPTVVAESTLATVAQWFEGLSLDNVRRRFRANLEIAGVPPFWEDGLVGRRGSHRAFTVGSVQFLGINPCLRCVVPSRDPDTGEVWPQFVQRFIEQRRAHLPPWIEDLSHFDNSYRLTVNTRIVPEDGQGLRLGDMLEVEHPQRLG